VNALAVERMRGHFGRSRTWQLRPADEEQLAGRPLPWPTLATIDGRLEAGAVIRATPLSDRFDWEAYRARNPDAEPLLVVREGSVVLTERGGQLSPRPGDLLVALAQPTT
jgi:hypothetical protein